MINPISRFYNTQIFPSENNNKKFCSYQDRVSFGSDITKVCRTKNQGDYLKIIKIFALNERPTNIFDKALIKFFTKITLPFIGKETFKGDDRLIYTIKTNNNIIGGAVLLKCPEQKKIIFKFLAIDKKYQCKKESAKSIYQIISQVISECKKDNIDCMEWRVANQNKKAYNMYKKLTHEQSSDKDFSYFEISLYKLEEYMSNLKRKSPRLFVD